MPLDEPTRSRIQSLIDQRVMLFMKGSREAPQCGFSATVVQILDQLIPDYATFDVLSDASVREGIKEFASWPTIPQLYVAGEFVGGCDIIQDLYAEGELQSLLGIDTPPPRPPHIEVTDAAGEQLCAALAGAHEGQALHLAVDARHRARLFLAPEQPESVRVESNGVVLHMDGLTASRSAEARIDLAQTPQGMAFQVQLPEAPPAS